MAIHRFIFTRDLLSRGPAAFLRIAAALLILITALSNVAADQIDWPTLGLTEIVTNTFAKPTAITHAGDGSDRLFIVSQQGQISIIQRAAVLPKPFLDLSDRVNTGGEQGLLGLAFPSGFATNRHFYVYYTAPTGGVVLSRFTVTTDANVADPASEEILLTLPKTDPRHNGGQISFGRDGYLYVGIGDGGPEGDGHNVAQNTTNLFGKILRIDVESGAKPYAIPPTNPFATNRNFRPEIWAYGLRNPWRFSFDRGTGDLYIGDVGQNFAEEIDFQAAGSTGGENYGWRIMEGPSNYTVPLGFTNYSSLTLPVASYPHTLFPGDVAGSVTGGYVYRGPHEPRMDGMYFFGDFMGGWIWGMKKIGDEWQTLPLITSNGAGGHYSISTFGEDEEGQVYFAEYYGGEHLSHRRFGPDVGAGI